ncbi:MAG: hypothetical protein IH946_09020 [Bacteroidetes bacterium]|nr:hypothetical protein [Bacteroidota bacterium]
MEKKKTTKFVNQLIFTKYSKYEVITIRDSFWNKIGKIKKLFNKELGLNEFVAYDHEENEIGRSEVNTQELQKLYTSHQDRLLKEAHARRIEANKRSSKEEFKSKTGVSKDDDKTLKEGTAENANTKDVFDKDTLPKDSTKINS